MSKVTIDVVKQAIAMRAAKATWIEVTEATGFNGATLRPHIARYEHSQLQRPPVNRADGDRQDSPLAIIVAVEPTAESITAARVAGMAWYAISDALGIPEAKVKGLAPEAPRGNQFAKVKIKATKDVIDAAQAKVTESAIAATTNGKGTSAERKVVAKAKAADAAAKADRNRKARERRAAKKAAASS